MVETRVRNVVSTALGFVGIVFGGAALAFTVLVLSFAAPPAGLIVQFVYAPSFALGTWLYEHDFLGTLSQGDDMAGIVPVALVMWLQSALMIAVGAWLVRRSRRKRILAESPA
ncbi:MAG: hypothetical protein Q7V14_05505 [Coriobacteriia bacterium]|nr:hypothetical protein [Coriobacteriia bacterium]